MRFGRWVRVGGWLGLLPRCGPGYWTGAGGPGPGSAGARPAALASGTGARLEGWRERAAREFEVSWDTSPTWTLDRDPDPEGRLLMPCEHDGHHSRLPSLMTRGPRAARLVS